MKDDFELLRGLANCSDKEQMVRYIEEHQQKSDADKMKATAKDTNVLSNGDRIRSMTDEELGQYLIMANDLELQIPFCQNKPECDELLNKGELTNGHCFECMMEWLQQPVEVE